MTFSLNVSNLKCRRSIPSLNALNQAAYFTVTDAQLVLLLQLLTTMMMMMMVVVVSISLN